ncbi:MAG: gamma-glutamylcyclotransferase [Gammaproteobacteria bacterium]|nr:gamma-glutamylcyclotransferase [Gammaproteobacteria bacterium]
MKRVAVYGTLLRGECREGVLKNSKLLGNFTTEPEYDMFSNGSYPFIIKGGNTPVQMEVYELDDLGTLETLDAIEGVSSGLYARESISTPYGEADYYVQHENTSRNAEEITSGSWREHTK